MTPETFFRGLRADSGQAETIRCLQLLRLTASYFEQLRAEVMTLVHVQPASDVGHATHVTNWTRPRGVVRQFSLLNASGRFDDFSADHDASCFGKRFHGHASYPALGRFIDGFAHAVNFRVNLMGPGAQLSPHEECVMIRTRAGSIGARVRCHLPIATHPSAELMLDGGIYHLAPGIIYFVNHGCVHAARNSGQDDRIHLVWDLLLTRAAFELMFGDGPLDLPAARIAEAERVPTPLRTERLGAYLRLPRPVSRDEADSLGWCEIQ
jgi:Aspartyl/Asparaginyl beta-hydroxylase